MGPLLAFHVVGRHEGRLAAHREPHVARAQIRVDALAERVDARPRAVVVGLRDARILAHALYAHRELELDLAVLDAAADRCGRRRIGARGERDVALGGEHARGGIESDPARAGEIGLGPRVQVGEVALGAGGALERTLVGLELDQISRHEARGEAELAQQLHEQPRAVAARARAAFERLLGGLHAWLHADQVPDLRGELAVQVDQEVDGAARRAVDGRETLREQRPRGHDLAERSQLALEPRLVLERKPLGRGLEEEIERILHRELGDQVDFERELAHLLGEHDPREPVRLRILLPVHEVGLRCDAQRIARDRRATVRSRAQPHDLRRQQDGAVVAVARAVMELYVDRHAKCAANGARGSARFALV